MKFIFSEVRKYFLRYRAILFILGLAILSVIGVIHLFNISNKSNVDLITHSSIRSAKKAFTDLGTNMQNMLSAAIEALSANQEVAEAFAQRDRDKLYNLAYPVFKELKRQNNITHMYFITPEPLIQVFLRVHTPHLFNDPVNRPSVATCARTKRLAFGFELGMTALAFRVVHPFYYQNQLIGYLELGVQVEDFFKLLKHQTGNEYGILFQKKYVNPVQWESIRREKKLRDNWNDYEYFILVDMTFPSGWLGQFQSRLSNLENIPDDGVVLDQIVKDHTHYIRGIFPFSDILGKKVGGVFFLKDISPIYGAMKIQKERVVFMLLWFMGIMTFFMLFLHKRAEKELRKYRTRLEEMVKESTSELLDTNRKLNLEIREHKEAQNALEFECRAREDAEKKQIEAVKHAERAARLASIGVMAASITHEINQPLNAIKVTADSIHYWHKRNPGVLPEPFTDQLNIITRSVKRIVEIIQHMRTFWVIPHAPEIAEVNFNKAIHNAFSLTRQQLHAHGIKEQMKFSSDPLLIKGNLVHFEQIIVNLVVNSIYALDQIKRRKNKMITIETYSEEDYAIIIIDDNGTGLPKEDTEKIFDPFFSTRSNDEGMGLGLAIVKRYIDQYKGNITATNNDEGGARFIIRFPLSSSESALTNTNLEEIYEADSNENFINR